MLNIRPGAAFGCAVNAHRSGWDGTICHDPATWDCNAPIDFRRDYCAAGDSRCFHVNLFHPDKPRLVVHGSAGDWLLAEDERTLTDQILLLWSGRAVEPSGIAQRGDWTVAGAYRVEKAQREAHGYRTDWIIEPYEGEYVDLSALQVRQPYFRESGGKYFKQVDRSTVRRLFEDASERSRVRGMRWSVQDRARFERFHEQLDDWLDEAGRKIAARLPEAGTVAPASAPVPAATFGSRPLGKIKDLDLELREPAAATPSGAPKPAPATPAPVASSGLSVERANEIKQLYGETTARTIDLALAVKPLVLFAGDSGVGKSYLATHLIDADSRDRNLVVPVASSWRSSEDLLGYVNPIDGVFEATDFTRFLVLAARAWDDGDSSPRQVVFEEFNLSQPEYWLSEILARTQYGPEERERRTIRLGGNGIRGVDGDVDGEVFLSPAVRFIGTLNNDPTSPALSSRVLDRSVVVRLELDPRAAIASLGLELEEPIVEAVCELDAMLRESRVGFSLRAGRSVQIILERGLAESQWVAVDHVLTHEVLSQVSLFATDTADTRLADRLADWSEGLGSRLTLCGLTISDWVDRLALGQDIHQA